MHQLIRRFFAAIPILDGMFRRLIWSRIHYPEKEMRLLADLPGRPFDVVLDVGAALGSYTWVLNRKATTVVAFEPGNLHYRNLTAGTWRSRVITVRAAVGSRSGTAYLITPGSDNNARHMATLSEDNPVSLAANAQRNKVKVVSLDAYVDKYLVSGRRIDLLKIDVEGFENDVLEGAKSLIRRDTPVIIAEIEARHNPNFAAFFSTLAVLGYTSVAYRNGKYQRIQATELTDMRPPDEMTNSKLRDAHGYINNFIFQHPKSAVKVVDL